MLPSETIFELTQYLCSKHGVSFEYCFPKMVAIEPKTGFELREELENLLSWAYFNDFYGLYQGIIPFRECSGEIDEHLIEERQ